ncbi:MAG: aldo/keto reductase [Alphaproteobacteria bacterium]|nr:aldo/keto reductase [Alphaproteobacteria bacterium]
MHKRKLGNSGLEVMPVCFGGNVFGWTIDEATSFTILDAFVGEGLDFIDTADVYSRWIEGNKGGESETILGNWFAKSGKRKDVVLATKVGMETELGTGLRKEHIMASVEASLKRLQTDYIDLYQSHKDDENAPMEETLAAYQQLIKDGKVRAIGASNFSAERLAKSLEVSKEHGLPRYESLQPGYNLYDREGYEKALEPLCRKENIGVISYYSLARGFLSGKYRSEADLNKSPRGKSVGENYLNERGFAILEALDNVAGNLNATPAQVALAWLIARPGITAPIVSATSLEQLKDITHSVKITLSDADIAELDMASAWQKKAA